MYINNMKKRILFIQPIVSHYRKSVVEEITNLEPFSNFWGTSDFQGVAPLEGISNVNNGFKTKIINISGSKFVWYKGLFSHFVRDKSTHVVLSGVNPLLINIFIIFIYAKLFTNKRVYWWSQGKRFKQGFFGKRFRYLFYKYSDGVFLYSKQGKENFIAEGLPEEKLHVINNCLNYEDYGWLNYPLDIKDKNEFRILYTGRLSRRKKINVLIEAFRLIKDKGIENVYLDIVGDGDQLMTLKKYAEQTSIDSFVNFHGAKYGEDVHRYFLNADLVVCPGAIGLSIVHAFSFGIPVITGKGDEAHSSELELLKQGQNGDYFELDNAESLAEKIIEWQSKVKKNRDLYKESCINTIITHEYLPKEVAVKLIREL